MRFVCFNLNSSVGRYKNNQPYEIKNNIFSLTHTFLVSLAVMFIASYSFIFAVLQFVTITRSLLIAHWKKQCRTLNTIHLRILDSTRIRILGQILT